MTFHCTSASASVPRRAIAPPCWNHSARASRRSPSCSTRAWTCDWAPWSGASMPTVRALDGCPARSPACMTTMETAPCLAASARSWRQAGATWGSLFRVGISLACWASPARSVCRSVSASWMRGAWSCLARRLRHWSRRDHYETPVSRLLPWSRLHRHRSGRNRCCRNSPACRCYAGVRCAAP